ncbi:DUF86 domain-containing protein [Magnetospirillum sp. UT-4]|uniref:HepT-like ribonuclease domain-containing protein n=1 Tax=Magnetospirillum sp. UT-4 TaxID=2681467 RepID=UPI00137E15FD|nr:HepT-like ribonuclease domain-containing protein [Magnetospirillum sp. UT-4]CAA7620747.1 conserved hypothetical protein [Magnetospirillum sp. UT-4]
MIEEIEEFVVGVANARDLRERRQTRRAVERCVEIICEAARKLGPEIDLLCPGPPWAEIRGMGNRMRHEYDGVSVVVLWGVVQEDLPPLRAACLAALEKLGH